LQFGHDPGATACPVSGLKKWTLVRAHSFLPSHTRQYWGHPSENTYRRRVSEAAKDVSWDVAVIYTCTAINSDRSCATDQDTGGREAGVGYAPPPNGFEPPPNGSQFPAGAGDILLNSAYSYQNPAGAEGSALDSYPRGITTSGLITAPSGTVCFTVAVRS
jgi:hypothetical protein